MNERKAKVQEDVERLGYRSDIARWDSDGISMPVSLSWHGPVWGQRGVVVSLTWAEVDELIARYPDATIAKQALRDVARWRAGGQINIYNVPGLATIVRDFARAAHREPAP